MPPRPVLPDRTFSHGARIRMTRGAVAAGSDKLTRPAYQDDDGGRPRPTRAILPTYAVRPTSMASPSPSPPAPGASPDPPAAVRRPNPLGYAAKPIAGLGRFAIDVIEFVGGIA